MNTFDHASANSLSREIPSTDRVDTPHSSPVRTGLLYLSQAIFVVLVACIGLRLDRGGLGDPWILGSDSMNNYLAALVVAEDGWWWHGSRHAAPFALDLVHFPVAGQTDYLGMWLVACFTSNPFAIVQAYFLLALVLAGWTCMWSMRRLGIGPTLAWGCGVLYAYLPHVFQRATGHLMLMHYVLPPMCMAAIRIGSGSFASMCRGEKISVFLFAFATGLSYVYQAFFAALTVGVAWGIALVRRQPPEHAQQARWLPLAVLGMIVSGTVLNLLPTQIAWRSDPIAEFEVYQERSAAAAEEHGLSARHLFMPRHNHPLRAMRWLRDKLLTNTPFPLDTKEGVCSYQGSATAIGLLVLLASLPIGLMRFPERYAAGPLCVAALLAIFCLLWSMTGGFGIIFNCLVSPAIRAYCRIMPVVSFLSLYAIASLLHRWVRFENTGIKGCVGLAAFLACVSALLFDQSCWYMVNPHRPLSKEKMDEIRPLAAALDRELPANAMIYQLPIAYYPNYRHYLEMDLIIPSMVARSLRWSYPPLNGQALTLRKEIDDLLQEGNDYEVMQRLRAYGFAGVYLDRAIYPDRADELEARLRTLLGEPTHVSNNSRCQFFPLTGRGTPK